MSGNYNETTMRTMGVLNAGWGICGVTSTLYAVYQMNDKVRGVLINAPKPYAMLAELKTFLAILKGDGNATMIQDTEAFTRAFGVVDGTDFSGFTVAGYIKYINESLNLYINKDTDEVNMAITQDAKFGIGLPPRVVAEYARRVWKLTAVDAMYDQGGDAIVGVKDGSRWFNGLRLYDGLVHYLYRKNGFYYTWGHKPYRSVADASANFEICCSVKLTSA